MLKPVFTALASAGLFVMTASAASLDSFTQANLTSDLAGVAAHQDTNLINPWGLAAGPGGPFWVSDNGSGLSTLYNGSGKPLSLVVTVPGPAGGTGPSAPTGLVFNSTNSFGAAPFIFDTENGTVSSWASGTQATLNATGASGSVYKGLAIGNNGSGNFLYAANFGLGRIDVYDSSFHPTTLPGGFSDPNTPAGYAPFDVRNVNGDLYVTYAKQDAAKHDDVPGPGNGFVDIFDLNGRFVRRLASQGALNSPWGLAVAPAAFGSFGGDLLVGNFGDGHINAYNMTTGALVGTLDDSSGAPIAIQGLWDLSFGNGAFGQNLDSLYFTAGIPGSGNIEDHGLFGSLAATTPTPEPSTAGIFAIFSIGAIAFFIRRRQSEAK